MSRDERSSVPGSGPVWLRILMLLVALVSVVVLRNQCGQGTAALFTQLAPPVPNSQPGLQWKPTSTQSLPTQPSSQPR